MCMYTKNRLENVTINNIAFPCQTGRMTVSFLLCCIHSKKKGLEWYSFSRSCAIKWLRQLKAQSWLFELIDRKASERSTNSFSRNFALGDLIQLILGAHFKILSAFLRKKWMTHKGLTVFQRVWYCHGSPEAYIRRREVVFFFYSVNVPCG